MESIPTSEAVAVDPRIDLHGKSAVIIEDTEEDRSLTAHVLQSYGMRVLTADSVQAALAILHAEPVDVIVSDIRLSSVDDGLDLMRETQLPNSAHACACHSDHPARPTSMIVCVP